MIEIHWGWIVIIAMLSGSVGFMCCALMVMAKQSDAAITDMKGECPTCAGIDIPYGASCARCGRR